MIYTKDPDEVLDYSRDWSEEMDAGDVIAMSEWESSAPTELVLSGETTTTTLARVFASGGIVDTTYEITNTVVTAAGRTLVRTIAVYIGQR